MPRTCVPETRPNPREGTFAPLSSRAAAENLAEQVADAVSKGATLHAGGVLGDGPAAYYTTAVLTGVTEEMRAYREELFGPVAVVYSVSSDDEACALVYGERIFNSARAAAERGHRACAARVAERLEVGMSNVNTPGRRGRGGAVRWCQAQRVRGKQRPLGLDEFVNKRMFYVAD